VVDTLKTLGADLARLETLGGNSDDFSKVMADVRERFPNAWNRWTKDEESELLTRFAGGEPLERIAEALGRPEKGVLRRLMKLGAFNNPARATLDGGPPIPG
jgi:hypothetical protein